ncbi:MAG: curli assembly protein CsgF [Bacteroidetes bacterium]|nr:curli assembly protein CsgF [Bacteroidota bacterium]
MKITRILLIAILLLGLSGLVKSQDMVFKFTNPMFGGGDTFMYQQLISSAQAQNTFEDDAAAFDPFQSDPLADFAEDLNRQILSQISRQLINEQFGELGLQEGTYILGSYQIDISNTGQGLSLVILDTSTGNQTSIVIPYF